MQQPRPLIQIAAYDLSKSDKDLKTAIDEAEKVCEKDALEKQLKRVETIFTNYMLQLQAITRTDQLISDVKKNLQRPPVKPTV